MAVVRPLPFTTCRREVEWILFGLATLIGTARDLITLIRFILDDLLSLFLDERNFCLLL